MVKSNVFEWYHKDSDNDAIIGYEITQSVCFLPNVSREILRFCVCEIKNSLIRTLALLKK